MKSYYQAFLGILRLDRSEENRRIWNKEIEDAHRLQKKIEKTIDDRYPIPNINDIVGKISYN